MTKGEMDEVGQKVQIASYRISVSTGDVIHNMMSGVNTAVWYV